MTAPAGCGLTACTICTGCAHGHYDQCRGEIRCPTTGQVSACRYAAKESAA